MVSQWNTGLLKLNCTALIPFPKLGSYFWLPHAKQRDTPMLVPGQGLCLLLVAPYCALPRDYLNDTPLSSAMGFWVSPKEKVECDTPPLACTSLQDRYLSDTCSVPRIPHQSKENECDTPSAIISRIDSRKYPRFTLRIAGPSEQP